MAGGVNQSCGIQAESRPACGPGDVCNQSCRRSVGPTTTAAAATATTTTTAVTMLATLGRNWRHFRWSFYDRPGFTFMVAACFGSPFVAAAGVSILRRFDYQRAIPMPRSYPRMSSVLLRPSRVRSALRTCVWSHAVHWPRSFSTVLEPQH